MKTTKQRWKHTFLKILRNVEGILYLLKNVLSERQFIYVCCVLVGISSSLAVIFLKSFAHFVYELTTKIDAIYHLPFSNSIFPVIGILLTVWVVQKILNGKIEKGAGQILIAVAKKSGIMPKKQMYAQIITSSLTVGMGGSAGLESPITITGAAFGSNFAQEYRLSYKNRTLLLACGVAAGIAAAFNAPIAGVLFAIEVVLADMSVSAFIPLMISSATGAIVSAITLKDNILLSFKQQLSFDYTNTHYYILLGILAGFFAVYHARTFRKVEDILAKKAWSPYKKALLGASILAVMIFIFPPLFGEGYESIKLLAEDKGSYVLENTIVSRFSDNAWGVWSFVLLTFFVKCIATGLTLGSGGNGGNFAPSLFVGSYLGYGVAKFIELLGLKNLPIENFTIVGMAGVLSGLFHAPLTAIFLIAEITGGYGLMVPLLIVSSLSFSISKRYDKYSMDIYHIADKGIVFTSDKDQNILSKIEMQHLVVSVNTLHYNQSFMDVQEIFKNNTQTVIPIVNDENQYVGVIDYQKVKNILFDNFEIKYQKITNYLEQIPSITTKSSASYALRVMEQHEKDFVIITQQQKVEGIVYKKKIMKKYRENLINLRIE
ncbi:chloride channel protein [Capnocytophaga sp. ARDL2]|uniref:chloride channel protein n=1 Tax=Capnocytophaga sp. ARDL2 TaxID=3238809 RepID=UPI0035567A40